MTTTMQAHIATLNVDMPPDQQLPREKLENILSTVFRELLPSYGYSVRESQTELAAHILDCLCRRRVSLAEAEVGTGKTLAYLAAAILVKRSRINDSWCRGRDPSQSWVDSAHMPVVVSTSSIALQSAIVREYIPALSRILLEQSVIQTPITAVVRKGRAHYLCQRRLHKFLNDSNPATAAKLAPLLEQGVDLTEATQLTPYMKRAIGAGQCEQGCPYEKQCRYRKHRRNSQSNRHDLQICNHQFFLTDMLRHKEDKPPLIPSYQAVIIDEAHKLLDAARQMYSVELPSNRISDLAADIRRFHYGRRDTGGHCREYTNGLKEQNSGMFHQFLENIPPQADDEEPMLYPAVYDLNITRHLGRIGKLAQNLAEELGRHTVLPLYQQRRANALGELREIWMLATRLQKPENFIPCLEKKSDHTLLRAIPNNLDKLLYRDLWGKGIPLVLTSGTLSAAGDFSRIKSTLGLHHLPPARLMQTSKPSPFDHRNNSLLYISENVPFPDNSNMDYITAVADEAERLIRASHGHAALLFTSYDAMGRVFAMLEKRGLPFPMFRMDRGDAGVTGRFKASGNGILFASGAFWEGIDIPGDALSLLIIVRLPFAVPDPISEYERTLYPNPAAFRNGVIIPDMIIRTKQGEGRGLRTETDTVCIAYLDIRARKGNVYHGYLIEALPNRLMTSDVNVVTGFFRDKKTPEYFR